MAEAFPAPLDDAALAATWRAAWCLIGRSSPLALEAQLMAAWAEPQRHYHDQQHLRECLALWLHWRDHCARPGEVAIALWFHDAIYDPQAPVAGSNEVHSAVWARQSLERAGADSDTAQRVHDLVMATQHGFTQETASAALGSNPDAPLLLDIDLAILGSPAERFELYDRDVRKEYAWVPDLRYREARAQVLQSFLDRPRLYHGEQAVALLEAQARINLAAALAFKYRRPAP